MHTPASLLQRSRFKQLIIGEFERWRCYTILLFDKTKPTLQPSIQYVDDWIWHDCCCFMYIHVYTLKNTLFPNQVNLACAGVCDSTNHRLRFTWCFSADLPLAEWKRWESTCIYAWENKLSFILKKLNLQLWKQWKTMTYDKVFIVFKTGVTFLGLYFIHNHKYMDSILLRWGFFHNTMWKK